MKPILIYQEIEYVRYEQGQHPQVADGWVRYHQLEGHHPGLTAEHSRIAQAVGLQSAILKGCVANLLSILEPHTLTQPWRFPSAAVDLLAKAAGSVGDVTLEQAGKTITAV